MSEATERAELLEPGREVWLGERRATVAWRKGTPARPLLKVEEIDDREGARALAGTEILAPGGALTLGPGEHFVDDLVGAEVVAGDRPVGRVADVVLLPSVEALEVECVGATTVLVPLVQDAIRSIDAERGRIDVDLSFVEDANAG